MPTANRTKVGKMNTGALQESDAASSEDDLRYCITKESMVIVKQQLIRLTKKNKEINASIRTMRESSVDELLSIMRTRKILIDQLGRDDLPDELRVLCLGALPTRKMHFYLKEEELVSVEELLFGHETVLEYARSACLELEIKIETFEDAVKRTGKPGFSMDEFPCMQALAGLTAQATLSEPKSLEVSPRMLQQTELKPGTGSAFALFSKLPVEVRLMVWRISLPGSRVITHSSKHNRWLSLLAVCTESRQVTKVKYLRFLSPPPKFPRIGSSVVYVNPDIDTVVRDLTCASIGFPDASLFDLEGQSFNLGCFRLFTGLSKIRHLALAFDVFHDNGGVLFSRLQACCPDLQTLTLFPSSQLERSFQAPGCSHHSNPLYNCQELRFVDFDSNFINFQQFRWDRYRHRSMKIKALRGLMTLASLSLPAQQYGIVFPEYIEQYGRDWKPVIRIGLLMRWNAKCQGWQTEYLEGDNYSMGFPGDDGETYHGFIESGIVCDASGELLSRYDGIQELFAEDS